MAATTQDTFKIQDSRSDRRFNIINYTILGVFLVIVFYPLYYISICSFSSATALMKNQVWFWPVEITFDGYQAIFRHKLIVSGFFNSVFYMTAGTAINLIVTVMAAYPLSRRDLQGRNFFMGLFLFTMMFNGGLIPTYLLVKNLHILNTRWAMILPGAMSVWNMIVMRTYFQNSIPEELREASELDGCSDFAFLFKIVLPLSGPILAVIALFYAVWHWNSFFAGFIYLKDAAKFPLQLVLRDLLLSNTASSDMLSLIDVDDQIYRQNLLYLLKYSTIVVASIPLLIVYPFVQRYFVKGMMIGSVKG